MLKEMLKDNVKEYWENVYREELHKFSTNDQKDFLVMLEEFKNKVIENSRKGETRTFLNLPLHWCDGDIEHKFEKLFKLYFKKEDLELKCFRIDYANDNRVLVLDF